MAELGLIRPEENVELIDGQIVAMSPQGKVHMALVSRLTAQLNGLFARDRYCVRPQGTLVLNDDYVPEPDIAVVAGRCEEHEREWPKTILLIVEVADSSLRLDRGRKSDLYARSGVQEYWIIDVNGGVVEVRREPSDVGYKSIRILQPEDTLLPLTLEGTGVAPLRAADLLPVG